MFQRLRKLIDPSSASLAACTWPIAVSWAVSLYVLIAFIPQATAAENNRLRLHHNCTTLDSIGIHSAQCYRLAADLFEGLMRVGKDGLPEPGVAERWDWDLATKTLTYRLKNNRFWSDGAPVVAEDFILSWKRSLMNPDAGNPLIGFLKRIKGSEQCAEGNLQTCANGLSAPDSKTLVIQLGELDRAFPESMHNAPLIPIPSHFYAVHGDAWTRQPDIPVNGAYQPKPGQIAETRLQKAR